MLLLSLRVGLEFLSTVEFQRAPRAETQLLTVFSWPAEGPLDLMLEIDETSNGRDVDLARGQEFELSLPENPTTGFCWTLGSSGDPVCALLSQSFVPPTGPPGAGGRHRWRFQAMQPGEVDVRLSYQRPWGATGTPARTFSLKVKVSP